MKQIRKTDENPHVISAATGMNSNHATKAYRDLVARHPDVNSVGVHVKFPDARGRKGQKNTPVTAVRGIVEIIMLLPGHHAARIRRQAAELLVRYLGGYLELPLLGPQLN